MKPLLIVILLVAELVFAQSAMVPTKQISAEQCYDQNSDIWEYELEVTSANVAVGRLHDSQEKYTTWGVPIITTTRRLFRYQGIYYQDATTTVTTKGVPGKISAGSVLGCDGTMVKFGESKAGIKEYVNDLGLLDFGNFISKPDSILGWYEPFVPPDFPANMGYQMKIYHRPFGDGKSFEGRMDSPVIVCQGFDPDYGSSGGFDMAHMEAQMGLDFIKATIASGRSVVLVKFERPNAAIVQNASELLLAIRWVHNQAPNKNMILIGPSMGGLIMRQALIYAAGIDSNDPNAPPISEFIAYDSPNWGAVIPMSVQAAVQYFGAGGITNVSNTQAVLWKNLTSPAASQMLLYQVPQRHAYTTSELNTMNSRGFGYTVFTDYSFVKSALDMTVNLTGYFWDPVTNKPTLTAASQYLRKLNAPENWAAIRKLHAVDGTPIMLHAVTDGSPDQDQGLVQNEVYGSGDIKQKISVSTKDIWSELPSASITAHPTIGSYEVTTCNIGSCPMDFGLTEPRAYFNIINKDSWNFNFSEPVFTENLPGSIRDSYTPLWRSFKGGTYGIWDQRFLDGIDNGGNPIMRGHAFIPTASAAGIQANYSDFNTAATWVLPASTTTLGATQSMFDQVFVNSKNEGHVLEGTSPAKTTMLNLIKGAK